MLKPLANQRLLGTSELSVGPISYGHWRLSEGNATEAAAKTRAALDAGMTMIDTASIYGYPDFGKAEELLGDVIKADPGMRKEMVLATKAGIYPPTPYDCRPDTIVQTCEDSLRRLNTDVIDLFYIHRPDMLTPHADVAEGLMRLVEAGKVREIAVSNYTPSMFSALQSMLPRPLVANQVEFSPVRQDPVWDGTLDQCQEYSSTLIAWSPLGGGALMTQDASEDSQTGRIAAALDAVADRNGVDRGAAALAFTMVSHPGIVPIIGTQRVERIAEANRALEVEMSREEYYAIVTAWRGVGLP